MKIFKSAAQMLLTAVVLTSCSSNLPKEAKEATTPQPVFNPEGNYVSVDYNNRNEGYDWVGVSVKLSSDTTLKISVRSRADKKKPTCTFDATATKINDTTYNSMAEGKSIMFVFRDSSLSISAEQKEDEGILNYYCSGGGSLSNTYQKIYEPLDEKQIDLSVFNKTLSLQNIGFEITTTGKGSIQQLTVQPFGLKTDNQKVSMEIDGSVVGAEIGDLNIDGFPEVLIYTTNGGSGSYGNVIGFSANNGKSISQITFPDITENVKANKGYMGHDEFAIVESNLVRRFKIYKDGDSNNNPTGDYRQIQYKLVNGEASRKFVIDKIVEFPSN